MRKPISTYCIQEAAGWDTLPPNMVVAPLGEEAFYCAFMRRTDGVHVMASVKDYGRLNTVHLSVGPIKFYRPEFTDAQWEEYLVGVSGEVVTTFFPSRKFFMAPADERKPDVRHYFSILEDHE